LKSKNAGANAEVKLDSDTEDQSPADPEPEVEKRTAPAVVNLQEEEEPIRPISAAEERPKLAVSQTTTTVTPPVKVSRTASKGSKDDDDKVWYNTSLI